MSEQLQVTELAPAKINLALHIRRRRLDGYHDLETLFAFTRFGDQLTATEDQDWSLTISGPTKSADLEADNLVLRAARAFAVETGSTRCFAFHLRKEIPVAAGLGGGSADAAAALRLLNRLHDQPLPRQRLEEMAARLGADVPACVRSSTVFATGIGENLEDYPPLSGLKLLLVNPGVPVSTGKVFQGWDGRDLGPLSANWWDGRNDLQQPALRVQPVIADVLHWLSTVPGAKLVRMSGSGATCFALFEGDVPAITPPHNWWAVATELL